MQSEFPRRVVLQAYRLIHWARRGRSSTRYSILYPALQLSSLELAQAAHVLSKRWIMRR